MFEITYTGVFIFITLAWVIIRIIFGIMSHKVDWKYEGLHPHSHRNGLHIKIPRLRSG